MRSAKCRPALLKTKRPSRTQQVPLRHMAFHGRRVELQGHRFPVTHRSTPRWCAGRSSDVRWCVAQGSGPRSPSTSACANRLGVRGIAAHVPAARAAVEGMRRRSDAEVGHAFPIAGVVPRKMPRPAEVADLVMHEPGLSPCVPSNGRTARSGRHRRASVTSAFLHLVGQRGAWFHRKAIGAKGAACHGPRRW